ncbi:hypothetical protein C0991_008719 [Blastosporella zonata]|nr:hypothetical protein C0991_008719 [Blastosporella zonata]
MPPTAAAAASTPVLKMPVIAITATLAASNTQSRTRKIIIPSTHTDQLNRIGSEIKKASYVEEKEPPEAISRPDWMNAAYAHFITRDLSKEWTKCIITWEHFEEALMYHNGKGLPAKD